MQTVAEALLREGLIGPHVRCAACGTGAVATEAEGWKARFAMEHPAAALCPACLLPALRGFLARGRVAGSAV